MPEHERDVSASQERRLPWWVRLCRFLWKLAAFLGVGVILALVINIASTWLTSSHGIIPADSPLGVLLAHWPTVLSISCCLLLLALLARMVSERTTHSPVSSSLAQQNRARMLGRLRLTYRDLFVHSLQGAMWMELGLSEKPDAVRNAITLLQHSVNLPERPLPAGTSILDAYNQVEGDLLILGAPGAGKSTLLLMLAQQLVGRATLDESHPLPVILPLSSWAVKRSPLHDWIVEQLTQIYDIPRHVSERWVQEDAILPLLDGLDEMDKAVRPACVAAINTYHQTHLGVPLVICSRTNEYDVATERQRLVLQCAVVVQPLTSQQVDAYLLQTGKSVVALRSAIKKNLALQELATTPLMLSVLMLTYQGATVRELPRKGRLLQQQVWTDYVALMVRRKGNEIQYPLERTRRWLIWLAQQMRVHQQTIFYAEYLHTDWLASSQQQAVTWLTDCIPAIILGGLAGILVLLFVAATFDLVPLLQFGLLGGFVGGTLRWNISTGTTEVENHLSRSKRVDLRSCILLSVLTAIPLGFSLRSPGTLNQYDPGFSLRDWMREGGLFGLWSGLSFWAFQICLFRLPKRQVSFSSTRPSLRLPIARWFTTIAPQNVWQAALALGVIMGLPLGLTEGLIHKPIEGLLDKLLDGLDGLIYGLIYGLLAVLICIILNVSLRPFCFAERIHWTWHSLLRPGHLCTSVIMTSIAFLLLWLSNGHLYGLSEGLIYGLSSALSLGLSYWLLFGLYQGMVQEHVEDQDRNQFNQGIRRSLRNGTLISIISASIIAGMKVLGSGLSSASLYELLYGSIYGMSEGWSDAWSSGRRDALSYGLSYGWLLVISGFLLMWAMSGGLTILRHYVIRWLLTRSHRFPWRAQVFLDDATARNLLQRVRGGYRFMHSLLLDYFADLDSAEASAKPVKAEVAKTLPPFPNDSSASI